MENKILTGIVALLVILQGYDLVGDIDPTHYSESLQEKRYCDRLSSTENTCYPYPETTMGKKFSSDGWKEIPLFQKPISIQVSESGEKYICSSNGCILVTI